MQNYFFELIDTLTAQLKGGEFLTASLTGEASDFVRINNNRIRQAGNVTQMNISVDLIEGQRHGAASCDLSGERDDDLVRIQDLLEELRNQRAYLPEDPYLNYATDVNNSERISNSQLPPVEGALDEIAAAGKDLDLVGIWASGEIYRGFANSAGQRNWHSDSNFNFDWSVYHNADKAVKCDYAGRKWDNDIFNTKMQGLRADLEYIKHAPKTLNPGAYRVYLAPAALRDIMDMMAWQGYGLKSHRTAQTPLIKMVKDGWRLNPDVSITEDHSKGLAADFTHEGFIKPQQVVLIDTGQYKDCLVAARSAREFDQPLNAASEYPGSLNVAAGNLAQHEILQKLDTGIYINNLWYCNFSDHNSCRITGMTRYACFWVENGQIVAPINVMRFDESIFQMLGDNLVALTKERELMLDAGTYGNRSLASHCLPGALVDDFTLTL